MNTIHLTPHGEELLQEQLARGSYRSPEEVIERALEALAERESTSFRLGPATKSPAEAVADSYAAAPQVVARAAKTPPA
jgi:Arc/MetJ-type ribon-helix-helix transcriptional regulator